EVHLLPDLGDGNGVEPLVGARIADIIEVVVNSGAAGALALVRRGQATNISPVVVAPEQGHVVGNAHALLVVFLDFFVERPVLRDGSNVFIHVAGDDRALVGDNLLEQCDVGALRHG